MGNVEVRIRNEEDEVSVLLIDEWPVKDLIAVLDLVRRWGFAGEVGHVNGQFNYDSHRAFFEVVVTIL